MGLGAGDRYGYTADGAGIYGTLGIEGITYEIGYDSVRRLLGDITGNCSLISAAARAAAPYSWKRWALGTYTGSITTST